MLRLDPDVKLKLDDQISIIPYSTLTSPKTIIEIPMKGYVDTLSEKNRNRRVLSTVFNDQGNEFDNNKLTKLDSITANRTLIRDNELSNKNISMMNFKKKFFSDSSKQ